MADDRRGKPKVFKINDFPFSVEHQIEVVTKGLTYKARDDDLFLVTYPKNGTTWTQQILTLMLNEGEIPGKSVFEVSPYLELDGLDKFENARRPVVLKTHLPSSLQPWNDQARYVIVIRNPKDVVVSYYHHSKTVGAELFDCPIDEVDFHDFFYYWIRGEQGCGCYFDWVLSWWNLRDRANIKFFFYEDMKSDLRSELIKMAEFIGVKNQLMADDEKILKKVLEKSTVEHMKKTTNVACQQLIGTEKFNIIRKGVIGDWRNWLTESESKEVDQMIKKKFGGLDLEHFWKKYGITEKI